MNNEKLVDAIGMLDENIIYDAKFEHIKRIPRLVQFIAAAIVIIVISGVLFGSGFYYFKNMGDNYYLTTGKYSFSKEKLLTVCNINLNKISKDNNNDTKNPSYNKSELYKNIGAYTCEIWYADEKKILFTIGTGIFIYDYMSDNIINSFDLEKIRVPGFNQGDVTTYISVDKSGDYALLESSENMFSDNPEIEYHLVNVKNGEVSKIKKNEIPDDFQQFETQDMTYIPKSDSDNNFHYPFAWVSSKMVSYTNSKGEKLDFYMNTDINKEGEVLIGNTDLVIVFPDGKFKNQRVFGSVFPAFKVNQ